jgi:hypothetical protein
VEGLRIEARGEGFDLVGIAPVSPSLEDVFLDVVSAAS